MILTISAFTFSACIAQRNSTSDSADNSRNTAESKPVEAQAKTENKAQTSEPEKKDQNTAFKNSEKTSAENKIENRCGWYENPTPGNHWLTDADGEWTIGTQGGESAEGDYPPEFSDAQWIKTNGNYGYGCACLRVEADKKEMRILRVVSGSAKPLSACRNDKALKEPAG